MALNARQLSFVDEYAVDRNATQSAIRAGYSPRTAGSQGSRLLKDVEVQAAINAKFAEIAARNGLSQDRVLEEIAALAYGDMREVADWDEGGVRFKHSEELTDKAARSIQSVKSRRERRFDREGNLVETTTLEMRQHSKVEGVKLAAQYLDLFGEKKDDGAENFERLLAAMRGDPDPRPPSGDFDEPWVDDPNDVQEPDQEVER